MIRSLRPDDGIRIAQFLTEVQEENWDLPNVISEVKNYLSLGCFINGQLAAFILYRKMGEDFEITWLCTRPSVRRRGHMNALLKRLVELCGPHTAVWLELRQSNLAALQLYEGQGFQKVGLRPGYYSDGEAATVMEFKPLQSL